jgi:hypothetical protein
MEEWLDPALELDLIAGFDEAVARAGMSGHCKIRAILKDSPETLVALGDFDADLVVFKLFRGPDAGKLVLKAAEALNFFEKRLQTADAAMVSVVATAPEAGILVMTQAAGTPVNRLLGVESVDQHGLMRRCANWLTVCAGDDLEVRRMAPGKPIQEVKALFEEYRDQDMHRLAKRLLRELRKQREPLKGHPLVWSYSHGDFAPVNASDDGSCLTAYDIQGVPRLPLARVACRFLVAKDLNRPPADRLLWGLDADMAMAFLSALPPSVGEDMAVIRFYIGIAMAQRLMRDKFNDEGRKAVKKRIQMYLRDPLPAQED